MFKKTLLLLLFILLGNSSDSETRERYRGVTTFSYYKGKPLALNMRKKTKVNVNGRMIPIEDAWRKDLRKKNNNRYLI